MAIAVKADEALSIAQERRVSQVALVWQRFRKHRIGLAGLTILTMIALAVIVVPFLTPFDYLEQNALLPLAPVGATVPADQPHAGQTHWLGTDELGRDMLARLFVGGRISLSLALLSAAAVLVLGAVIGTAAGYYGGWVDSLLMRFADVMLAFPLLPAYLIASKILQLKFDDPLAGAANAQTFQQAMSAIFTAAIVFMIFGWMGPSRQVRGSVLSLRSSEFVEAARALGADNRRIIFRHLIPNAIAPVLLTAILAVGDFIIFESVLSYLGGGIQYPTPSWGNLIRDAQQYVWVISDINPLHDIRPYLLFLPGLLILLTVLSLNFIGDALRDAFDPR